MHLAKAVGWNEMPFSRDIDVVPSNIVLERGPVKICIANVVKLLQIIMVSSDQGVC